LKFNIAIDEIDAEQKLQKKLQDRIFEFRNLAERLNNKAIDILDELELKTFDLDRDTAKFKQLALLIKWLAEIMNAPILDANGNLNLEVEILIVNYSDF
jgi:hypothetical protein